MSADIDVVQYGEDIFVQSSGFPHRVIPAVVGGVFAGLLLVGLGCTPLFKPQSKRPAPEQGTIVQGKAVAYVPTLKSDAGATAASTSNAQVVGGPKAKPAFNASAPAPKASSAGGVSTVAASSSKRGGILADSASTHRFSVICEPDHGGDPASGPRPESAALQGIMAGSQKAALLDGVLYREGDAFGSSLCPWTVAMIDTRCVRIEKAFGDRTAGVTIHWQNDKPATKATSSAPPPPRPRAMTSASASPRSR